MDSIMEDYNEWDIQLWYLITQNVFWFNIWKYNYDFIEETWFSFMIEYIDVLSFTLFWLEINIRYIRNVKRLETED